MRKVAARGSSVPGSGSCGAKERGEKGQRGQGGVGRERGNELCDKQSCYFKSCACVFKPY